MALGTVLTSQSLSPTDRKLGLFSSLNKELFFYLKVCGFVGRILFFNGMGFGFSGTEYNIQS